MNAVRRKTITKLIGRLNGLLEEMEDLLSDIDIVREEESEALNNIPESLMETDRYAQSEAAADNLEEAYDTLSDMKDSLEDVVNSLEAAKE